MSSTEVGGKCTPVAARDAPLRPRSRRAKSTRCMPRPVCRPWTSTSNARASASAGATPRGTSMSREQLAALPLASGDYELWLTAAGNPANVLLATGTVNLPTATPPPSSSCPKGTGALRDQRAILSSAQSRALRPEHDDRVSRYQWRDGPGTARLRCQRCLFAAVVLGRSVCRAYGLCAGSAIGRYTDQCHTGGNPGVLELETRLPGICRRTNDDDVRRRHRRASHATSPTTADVSKRGEIEFMNAATQFRASTSSPLRRGRPGHFPRQPRSERPERDSLSTARASGTTTSTSESSTTGG